MKLFKEKRQFFPDPRQAVEDGLVAFGDELNTDLLFEAYSFGIFPWPQEGLPLMWFSPDERGVLDFEEIHLSKSFRKFLRQTELKITFNQNFETVVERCAEAPRRGQFGTWITEFMIREYVKFHQMGYAQSVECWQGTELVGGLYGVYVGGVFAGESMFHTAPNASKLCLIKLIEKLKENGLQWMDIQMITPVTEAMGGKYITRDEFMERIKESKQSAGQLHL